MKKVNAAELLRQIDKRANESPFRVDFEMFKYSKFTGHRVRASIISAGYEKEFKSESRRKRYVTLKRNQAIHSMLFDRVWSAKLAGIHQIKKEDVTFYYSRLIHMRIMINNDFGLEFREFVMQRAKECFEIENQKKQVYLTGIAGGNRDRTKGRKGLFRNLLAGEAYKREHPVPPRLMIEEELFPRTDEISIIEEYHNEIDSLYLKSKSFKTVELENGTTYRLNKSEISEHKYKKSVREIKSKIKALQKRRQWLYDVLFLDGEANDNFTFIKAVGIWYLERGNKELLTLNVTSVGQGEALTMEYMRWFNLRFSSEIVVRQKEDRLRKDKESKELKRSINKLKKLDRDRRVIALYEEGISKADIHRQTNVAVRTVGDIIKRHESGIEVEIDVSAQELVTQREQEISAREVMIEQEIARYQNQEKARDKQMYQDLIIRLHNKGKKPTQISKTIVMVGARQIAHDLTALNIEPHFDFDIATEEQKKAKSKENEEGGKISPPTKLIGL